MNQLNEKVSRFPLPLRMRNRPVSIKGFWMPVPDLPFVEVSRDGQVRTLEHTTLMIQKNRMFLQVRRGRILRQTINRKGYCRLTLSVKTDNDKHKQCGFFVHRLVCLAFHGKPPPGKPWALHKDDDHTNNNEDNLYWGNASNNMYDRVANRVRA